MLDGRLLSTPMFMGPITKGWGQIANLGTWRDSQELAVILSGGLPLPPTVVEQRLERPAG